MISGRISARSNPDPYPEPHLGRSDALRVALLQRGAGGSPPLLRVSPRLGPLVQLSHQPCRSGGVDTA